MSEGNMSDLSLLILLGYEKRWRRPSVLLPCARTRHDSMGLSVNFDLDWMRLIKRY